MESTMASAWASAMPAALRLRTAFRVSNANGGDYGFPSLTLPLPESELSAATSGPVKPKFPLQRKCTVISIASGHRRTPRRPRCRHGEDCPMGAGKPGLQRREMIDDFRLWGSRTWRRMGGPFQTGVAQAGGARSCQLQICTIRGRSPRRCGPGCAWKALLDAGWHGFPGSSAAKRSAAPACVSPPRHGASWRRTGGGGSGGSDPPF